MNAVVRLSLLEQGGMCRYFTFDEKWLDQEQLVIAKPPEHTVFTEKIIVYRAFAHM